MKSIFFGQRDITAQTIHRFTGLKPNTLHYYVREQAVIPDVFKGSSQGTQKLFSSVNVMECALIQFLINFHIPRRDIVALLKSIRETNQRILLDPAEILNDDRISALLFSSGHDVCRVVRLDNEFPIPLTEGFMVINLSVFARRLWLSG